MAPQTRTLGTLLRHLIELLDGAVEQAYVDAQLNFRPRYTPVLRSLMALGPASIKAIAAHAGLTHSATSQTVAQMKKAGLLVARPGADLREQVVSLTPKADAMIPQLKRIWHVVSVAADGLDAEVAPPLFQALEGAIAALERQTFNERIQAVAGQTGI